VLDFGPDALLGVFDGLRRGDDLELRLLRAGHGNGVCSLGGWVYDARYSLSFRRQLASAGGNVDTLDVLNHVAITDRRGRLLLLLLGRRGRHAFPHGRHGRGHRGRYRPFDVLWASS
jgi:hypothetical protein